MAQPRSVRARGLGRGLGKRECNPSLKGSRSTSYRLSSVLRGHTHLRQAPPSGLFSGATAGGSRGPWPVPSPAPALRVRRGCALLLSVRMAFTSGQPETKGGMPSPKVEVRISDPGYVRHHEKGTRRTLTTEEDMDPEAKQTGFAAWLLLIPLCTSVFSLVK